MIRPSTTFGLEVELQHLSRTVANGLDSWLKYALHDDGSIRGNTYNIGEHLAVYPEYDEQGEPILCAGMRLAERVGLEITTDAYPYTECRMIASKLAHYFQSVPQTPRTSIHIHVDVGNEDWKTVRNVILWAHALEAPLYRLASAGQYHRGERIYNGEPTDHMYARPLSSPIGITWGRSLGALISIDAMQSATTASEFAATWGRMDQYWSGVASLPHYCPHRLHMVNLVSVYRRGTMEWRLFDGLYSLLPYFVDIVYKLHELADSGPPDFAPMVLGSEPDIDGEWMSRLLDVDCTKFWGNRWPAGCTVKNKRSHYNDAPVLQPVSPVSEVCPINNGVTRDSGSSDFALYVRR